MRRHDSAGRELGRDAFVFGNALGEPVASVDTAWRAACRRAGIIGLHFHDLRREGGSRLLEGGVPEHYVQRFLDHANLSTTSRYLKTTRQGMHQALKQYELRRISKKLARSDEDTHDTAQTSVDNEATEVVNFQALSDPHSSLEAPSPSGKAEVCKTSIPGSIPGGASNLDLGTSFPNPLHAPPPRCYGEASP